MAEWYIKRLVDLKARQEAGEHLPCPRCGRDTMKGDLHTNALSRMADIYICNQCGTGEAICDFMKNPFPVNLWACMREKAFLPDSISGYLPMIQKQIPFLEALFMEYERADEPEDFTAYRHVAMRHCPGVSQLWTQPFMVEYRAKDGSRAMICFRVKDGIPEHSIHTFEK